MLVEWNNTLLSKNIQGFHALLDFWNYGTMGYIIPNNWITEFQRLILTDTLNDKEIETYFENIVAIFWVKGELDEIWVLSYKMDTMDIAEKISSLPPRLVTD